MNNTAIKAERTLYSWNSFLEAFLFPVIYRAFSVGDEIVFVKVGNMFWFMLAGCCCFCPVIIPILVTMGNISKARRTIQAGNITVVTSDPDNLALNVTKRQKPAMEKGMMGQECITVQNKKIYSHFMLDKTGLRKFIDECWS
ncbi:MAG TPA: hypothetical protein PK745_17360 [bacterium]|nr:hypothetical protein [bacterium]